MKFRHRHQPNVKAFTLVFLALVVGLFAIQILMVPRVTFNWDELQEIATLFSKESGYAMQSMRKGLHYLIWPLKYLDSPETTLLQIARYWTLLTSGLGIYFLIFKIGARLRRPLLGLMAVFLAMSFATFYETLIEYRTDSVITCLFLWAFYALFKKMRGDLPFLLPGCLMGLALFVNPKGIYGVATLFACFGYLFLFGNKKHVFWRAVGFGAVLSLVFLGLTYAHNLLYEVGAKTVSQDVNDTALTGFGNYHGWRHKRAFLVQTVALGWMPFLCLLTGLIQEVRRALGKKGHPRPIVLVLVAALCQLGTLTFHQGVYTYYIIDILPLAAVIGARPLYRLLFIDLRLHARGSSRSTSWRAIVVIGVVVLSCLSVFSLRVRDNLVDGTINQHRTLGYLNQIFPSGIAYADGVGLMGRNHNVMHLFTAKKYVMYTQSGRPMLEPFFRKRFPAFVLPSMRFPLQAFFPEDQAFVKEHFVPFFGERLWVYGWRFPAETLKQGVTVEVRVPGPFQVSGHMGDLTLNGRNAEKLLNLERGPLRLACNTCGDLQLTFGKQKPTDVVTELLIGPLEKGSFHLEQEQRLYLPPGIRLPPGVLFLDGKPLTPDTLYPNHDSILLGQGDHHYENKSTLSINLSAFGPIYTRYLR